MITVCGLVAVGCTDGGLKLQVTREDPLQDNETTLPNPLLALIVVVSEPVPPGFKVIVEALNEPPKSVTLIGKATL